MTTLEVLEAEYLTLKGNPSPRKYYARDLNRARLAVQYAKEGRSLPNKNHVISTRRVNANHYQIVITNVQSGTCLKILADAVRTDDMTLNDYESYIEGLYQGFCNPMSFEKLFYVNNYIVTEDDGSGNQILADGTVCR